MLFEWDENKRQLNLEKHKLDFMDAEQIFEDENAVTFEDKKKDYGETRFITVGIFNDILLTSVCHTDRNGITRLISFRPASKKEKELYYARKNSKIYK